MTAAAQMRTLSVAGLPERLTREQMATLIAGVGLDPEHLVALEFQPEAVYATVWALTPSGRRFATGHGEYGYATHRVCIPVLDDGEDDRTTEVESDFVLADRDRADVEAELAHLRRVRAAGETLPASWTGGTGDLR